MHIKHLLVGGNSFTQDGIGGVPPTERSDGGCSYLDQGGYIPSRPNSWASWVAKNLNVTSFVNTAAASHGNFLICDALIYMLSNYQYKPEDTFVLFNISIPERLDFFCEFSHPDFSKFIPWSKDLIPFGYITRESSSKRFVEKTAGLDLIPLMGWQKIVALVNFLENKKFQYAFLTTEDYTNDKNFQQLIQGREDKFISLEPGVGMLEWGQLTGLNTENNYHPDDAGRQVIADVVCKWIKNNVK